MKKTTLKAIVLSLSILSSGGLVQAANPARTHATLSKIQAYEILGIDAKSDKATIKKAYKKLAMKYHPDKNDGAGDPQKFTQADDAYKRLTVDSNLLDPNEVKKLSPADMSLQQAWSTGNLAQFTQALNDGANPNMYLGEPGYQTHLSQSLQGLSQANNPAQRHDIKQWVEALVAHKASLDQPVNDALSPLMMAVSHADMPLAELLLNNKADVDYRRPLEAGNWLFMTPLMLAINKAKETGNPNHHAIADLLLAHNANPDETDSDGFTTVQYAVWHGFAPLVKKLADLKANVDAENKNKDNALMVALANTPEHARHDVVRALLDNQADVDLTRPNNDGKTLEHLLATNNPSNVLIRGDFEAHRKFKETQNYKAQQEQNEDEQDQFRQAQQQHAAQEQQRQAEAQQRAQQQQPTEWNQKNQAFQQHQAAEKQRADQQAEQQNKASTEQSMKNYQAKQAREAQERQQANVRIEQQEKQHVANFVAEQNAKQRAQEHAARANFERQTEQQQKPEELQAREHAQRQAAAQQQYKMRPSEREYRREVVELAEEARQRGAEQEAKATNFFVQNMNYAHEQLEKRLYDPAAAGAMPQSPWTANHDQVMRDLRANNLEAALIGIQRNKLDWHVKQPETKKSLRDQIRDLRGGLRILNIKPEHRSLSAAIHSRSKLESANELLTYFFNHGSVGIRRALKHTLTEGKQAEFDALMNHLSTGDLQAAQQQAEGQGYWSFGKADFTVQDFAQPECQTKLYKLAQNCPSLNVGMRVAHQNLAGNVKKMDDEAKERDALDAALFQAKMDRA